MSLNNKVTNRSKVVWNMIGSMSNALSSLLLLTIVTRINGTTDAGLFSLAFSTAQLLTTVSCFETRAIQATDVQGEYKFKQYFTFRICTCCCMMLLSVGFIVKQHYEGIEAFIIFFICLYKCLDSISDSYQGMFQQKDRIDLSGKALGMRVMLSTFGFFIVLLLTHNMLLASISMVIISIIFIYLFDRRKSFDFDRAGIEWNIKAMKNLFKDCLPLFISSFMISYVLNASKYAIEKYASKDIQAYYGFLLMPAFVVNLFTLFAFRPMMTPMAIAWNEKNLKKFKKIIVYSCGWALFLTLGAVVGSYILGIPILNFVSGIDLSQYRYELCLVMLGGGLNALITIFYYILAILRQQKKIVICYGVGFIAALTLSPAFVNKYGITGAVMGYVIPMLMIVCVMVVLVLFSLKKEIGKVV